MIVEAVMKMLEPGYNIRAIAYGGANPTRGTHAEPSFATPWTFSGWPADP
jgi:hypothetical protein